jgi:hypothetical protein
MAGLFSGAGEQVGAAEENIGETLFKAGMTVYDKVNEAEIAVQSQQGQLILSKAMNDFDTQLSKNPDPSTYEDSWNKAKDEAWKLADGAIKNQGAKNALHEWWQSASMSQAKKVNQAAINTRIGNATDQLKLNISTLIQGGEQNKAAVMQAFSQAQAINLISPANAELGKENALHEIDLNSLFKIGHDIAFDPQGNEKSLDAGIDAIMKDTDHHITDDEKAKMVSDLQTQHEEARKLAKEKTDDENASIRDQATKDIIDGKLGPTGIAKLQFKGLTAGPEMQSLTSFWENLHRDQNANNPGYGYALVYDKLTDDTLNISDKSKIAAEAYGSGDINKGQLDHLMTEIQSGISKAKAQGLTYLNEGAHGTIANPALYDQEDALKATNMLEEALAKKGMDASPQYVQQQAEIIKKLFSDKAIRQAIDDQFVVETKQGAAGVLQWVGLTPKAGTPKQEDLSSVLHAWSNKEFAGTEGTEETATIIGGVADQVRNLIAKKYNVDPKGLKLSFDADRNMVFTNQSGNQVRVTEKNGKIIPELGTKAPTGVEWVEDGSL